MHCFTGLMAAAVALLGGAGAGALALDTPNERVTLAGLTGVHVVVDEVGPEAERAGLARADLQADVENRLRRAGLRVFTAAEALVSVGRPTVHVRVALFRPREAPDLYTYSVDLTLRQQIRLVRDRSIESFAVTWSDTRKVGAVEISRLAAVRDAVRAKVEQFAQAWQTVNYER